MKKSVWIIVICLLLVGVFATTYNISLVGADSGFDSSYDGGSSFGGSSSSDSSGYSSGGGVSPVFAYILLYILGGIIGIMNIGRLESKSEFNLKRTLNLLLYIMHILIITCLEWIFLENKILIIFAYIIQNLILIFFIFKFRSQRKRHIENNTEQSVKNNELVKEAFDIYAELQIAWMNFDYKKIKELVSDEMYNMYINQLETLKIKSQQNIMSEIEFVEGSITECKKVNNKEIFKIYMSVRCFDHVINTETQEVVRGDKNKKLTLNYLLTFERNIQVIENCPQCGSDVKNLTECFYCKSKIVNNTSKLKMTKKQIMSQK